MNNIHAPFQARLDHSEDIADDTRRFRFELIDRELSFTPGQFFLLQVDEKTHRSYSLASCPEELPFFDLIVKYLPDGKASGFLWQASPGDLMSFRGPMGRFGIRQPEKDQVFIATGTGLAPIRSIWRHLVRKEYPPKMELYFGVRHENNLFCMEEMEELTRKHPDTFRYHVCLSRPKTGPEKGVCFTGRVTDYFRAEPAAAGSMREYTICGSKPMVEEIRSLLIEAGVQKEDINVESW